MYDAPDNDRFTLYFFICIGLMVLAVILFGMRLRDDAETQTPPVDTSPAERQQTPVDAGFDKG